MKLAWPVEIVATGVSLPDQIVTNDDLARDLDTSDEWIAQRTGIRERRVARPGEATLLFATRASQMALTNAGLSAKDIDLIICATITPEHMLPSTSCELQAALGCGWIPAFDLSAACSGFAYGLIVAAQALLLGTAKTVLVVGAETLTRVTDMQDRSTAVLFGDGAGAAIVRRRPDDHGGILAVRLGADGARGMLIWIPAGGAREPASVRSVNEHLHYMRMKGREVYKFAVTQMHEIIRDTAEDAGVSTEDVALIVPHQSNLRIIESACEKAGIPLERVWIDIDRLGNTSAASIPIALHEAWQAGRIKPGDLVMLVAFGAGLTWASVLLRL